MEISNPKYEYEETVWYYKKGKLHQGIIKSVEISKNYSQITSYIMKNGEKIQDLHVFKTPDDFFNLCKNNIDKQIKSYNEYGSKLQHVDLSMNFGSIYS